MEYSKFVKGVLCFGFSSVVLLFVGFILVFGSCIFNPEIQNTGRETFSGQLGFFLMCVGALGVFVARLLLPDDDDDGDEEDEDEETEQDEKKKDSQ